GCARPIADRRPADRLAVAVRSGDDPLGRQGPLPAADPIPGAQPCRWSVAVLDPLRVRRPSANRRSAVDDLCPAVSGPGADRRLAEPVGGRYHLDRDAGPERRRTDALVP